MNYGRQTYFFLPSMEDDLNFVNGRRPQFCKWKTTSIFVNGRQPQLFSNIRRLQHSCEWKTATIFFQMNMNRGMNQVSDSVAIQDKTNPGKAGKWTKSGVITDYLGFQKHEIKIDGSNHLSTRHRSHFCLSVRVSQICPKCQRNLYSGQAGAR